MTLKEYQGLARAYSHSDDEVVQIALAVCEVYGFTHDEVDNMKPPEFLSYTKQLTRLSNRIIRRPWYFPRILITEAEKINLGQFIEVQHWLKMGEVDSLPLIAASLIRWHWVRGDKHKRNAELMLKINVRWVLHDTKAFLASFQELLDSYAGLFEKPELRGDETDEQIEAMEKEKALEVHPFIDQYGWIYSAKKVAEYEGITLEQAYNLPVVQAFNDLAYLKSEQDYLKQMNK